MTETDMQAVLGVIAEFFGLPKDPKELKRLRAALDRAITDANSDES